MTFCGRAFRSLEAANGKARSPTVDSNRTNCYAEPVVSCPAVAETIASTHCSCPRRDGQAGWMVYPTKVVTNPSANRDRRIAWLCWCYQGRYHLDINIDTTPNRPYTLHNTKCMKLTDTGLTLLFWRTAYCLRVKQPRCYIAVRPAFVIQSR